MFSYIHDVMMHKVKLFDIFGQHFSNEQWVLSYISYQKSKKYIMCSLDTQFISTEPYPHNVCFASLTYRTVIITTGAVSYIIIIAFICKFQVISSYKISIKLFSPVHYILQVNKKLFSGLLPCSAAASASSSSFKMVFLHEKFIIIIIIFGNLQQNYVSIRNNSIVNLEVMTSNKAINKVHQSVSAEIFKQLFHMKLLGTALEETPSLHLGLLLIALYKDYQTPIPVYL